MKCLRSDKRSNHEVINVVEAIYCGYNSLKLSVLQAHGGGRKPIIKKVLRHLYDWELFYNFAARKYSLVYKAVGIGLKPVLVRGLFCG